MKKTWHIKISTEELAEQITTLQKLVLKITPTPGQKVLAHHHTQVLRENLEG